MKALVTGGAGFIGSHLVEHLVEEGHQVVVLDDLSQGSLENLELLLGRYGFLLRVVDLLDREALDDAFAGVDWVFHLAGTGNELTSLRDPAASLRSHVEATLQVLESARRVRVKALVYAGCAGAYFDAGPQPLLETARLEPPTPHALTKRMAEELTLSWARIHSIPAVSLRLFHVYGDRSRLTKDHGSVVSVFMAQHAAGAPLTICGGGHATRDFVHVDDVTRAFLAAAQTGLRGEVINIGSGVATSVADLAEHIGGARVSVARRPHDRLHQCADIARARRLLQWQPTRSLVEGLTALRGQAESWDEAPVWTAASLEVLHGALSDSRGSARRTLSRPAGWTRPEEPAGPPSASFPLPF